MKPIVILLFVIVIAILILSMGKFFFGNFPLELFTHFQVQYFSFAAITAVIIGVFWWQGKIHNRALLCLLLFTLTLNLIDILPWYLSRQQVVTNRTDLLRVMSFNICANNHQDSAIVQSIAGANPDLVILVEIDRQMMKKIAANLSSQFPYNFRSNGGLSIFSKLPLQAPIGEKFSGSNATNLVTKIEYANHQITIIGVHPFSPRTRSLFEYRNRQLGAIANHLQNTQDSVIVLGDFNLTPWSPYYRQFVRLTGLHNTRLGFGILPTWVRPATHINYPGWLFPLLNIPIDHIFISQDLKVIRTYSGDPGNSDHAPIISELSLLDGKPVGDCVDKDSADRCLERIKS